MRHWLTDSVRRCRKKAVRVKIIREAEAIAEEVGHGNKPVPFQPFRLILPPRIAVIVREKFPGWL